MNGGGADLNYTDDDLDSYSTIWEGEVTNTTDADHERVVTALQKAGEGEELETYLDVDNLLRYMAVHSFVVNEDSLSGNMPHNYYLYEYDGQLNIIPWDYNLTLGGMGMGDASSVINDPIDTPFSGTDFFDALLENEEYLEQYHTYYRQLVEEYVFGGGLEETYNRIRSQIDSLVETDPTAFYSYEEYEAAAEILYETVLLRAESAEGQLDGTIPSTEEGQRADSSALIDASSIDLSVMGSMMGGGGGGRGGETGGGRAGNAAGAAPSEKRTRILPEKMPCLLLLPPKAFPLCPFRPRLPNRRRAPPRTLPGSKPRRITPGQRRKMPEPVMGIPRPRCRRILTRRNSTFPR